MGFGSLFKRNQRLPSASPPHSSSSGAQLVEVTVALADPQASLEARCRKCAGGLEVSAVTPGGPAERAGIAVGDVLERAGGVRLLALQDYKKGVAAAVQGVPSAPYRVRITLRRAMPQDAWRRHTLKAAYASHAITQATYDAEMRRASCGTSTCCDSRSSLAASFNTAQGRRESSLASSFHSSNPRRCSAVAAEDLPRKKCSLLGVAWEASPTSRFRRFAKRRASPSSHSLAVEDPLNAFAFNPVTFATPAEAPEPVPGTAAALRKLFENADKDGAGVLGADDFAACCEAAGMAKEETARAVARARAGYAQDGGIDYAAWLVQYEAATEGESETLSVEAETETEAETEGDGCSGRGDAMMTDPLAGDVEFPSELLEDLHEGFARMDVNGDGVVSEEEICEYLSEHGYDNAEATAKALMSQADRDGNGVISFVEFISNALGRK